MTFLIGGFRLTNFGDFRLTVFGQFNPTLTLPLYSIRTSVFNTKNTIYDFFIFVQIF